MQTNATDPAPRPAAWPAPFGWRLLALTYDSLPLIPLLFVVSGLFLVLNGGKTVEHRPLLQWLELGVIWGVIGLYFVLSWRRGGQTMGMRPWRLRVVSADGSPATTSKLWLRYAVATFSFGLGLLWALFDRDKRALYDRAADTAFVRLEKMGSE